MNKTLILVVEDDRPIRNLIITTLKTHDYKYLAAENGSSAILEASSHHPDIVLLDLGLPDMEGVEVIKKIRTWSNMPIIVISIAITVLTAAVCFFFGKRFGGSNDFERTLGLYGTCTGTVASGISLVRIVDPEFKTTTALELGMMNLVMLLSTPVYILLLGMASGEVGKTVLAVSLSALVVIYVVLLRVFKAFGKRTY